MNNMIIRIDLSELHRPRPTLQARFGASYRLKITCVPRGVDGVYVRIFTPSDGYFDSPANVDGNGDWECYLIGTTFPEVGTGRYEIRATDEYGNPTALGTGKVVVSEFSVGNSPIEQGSEISVATLPDESGALHQVVAVNLGTAEEPDWTWQVKTINGAQ